MEALPFGVVELRVEKLCDWIFAHPVQRIHKGIGAENPEHVKPTQRVERSQPLRVRGWSGGVCSHAFILRFGQGFRLKFDERALAYGARRTNGKKKLWLFLHFCNNTF